MSEIIPKVGISDDVLDQLGIFSHKDRDKVIKFIKLFRQNPKAPSINYEKINGAKDPNLRSVRIGINIRGIVLAPQTGNTYYLLWVDNHDAAYQWALNRKAKVNSHTGSLQVYAVHSVDDSSIVSVKLESNSATGLFDSLHDRQLKQLGVPAELIPMVRTITSEDEFDKAEDKFPHDAYAALFMFVAGETFEQVMSGMQLQQAKSKIPADDFASALQTPASKQKYWLIDDDDLFESMLDSPLEKWRVFLHPTQRNLVDRNWSGPMRVLGGAGTGKTIVGLHRVRWLAANMDLGPDDRILLTTYTTNLAADLKANLQQICNDKQLTYIEVINIDAWVNNFLTSNGEERRIVFTSEEQLSTFWDKAISKHDEKLALSKKFYISEWYSIVQAHAITNRADYLAVSRVGRGTRLTSKKRSAIWKVFQAYRAQLDQKKLLEQDDAFRIAREKLTDQPSLSPYKSIVVDEAQDIGQEAFRLLRALVAQPQEGKDTNSLFILGDGHQRIYGKQVVLKRSNINIRGRSRKLRLNYRTSDEIRKLSLTFLADVAIDDLDGSNDDDNKGCRSLFHGPKPQILHAATQQKELVALRNWIEQLGKEGINEASICVTAYSNDLVKKYQDHLKEHEYQTLLLKSNQTDSVDIPGIRLATMHRIKGLEFVAVAIVAMNDWVIPHKKALATAAAPEDRAEIIKMSRMLLHVASSRAKKKLFISSYGIPTTLLPTTSKNN